MLAASLNAFFCASPIYGSAEDFTFLLDVTVSREVTPAAKQQIGETRKKCNSDDRRLRRIQGGAVGAAVSRTRVPLKARSGRWAPQPVLAKRLAFLYGALLLWGLKGASSPFFVRGKWSPEDERGASKRPSCPLAQRSVRRRCRQQKAYNLPYSKSFCTESHFTRSIAFLC